MAIGWVGLGIMGKPMALNLLAAGHELVVASRSRGPVDELAGAGAEAVGSPREVAERSEIVITMLPDSPQVREVVAGEDGLLEGASDGDLLIDMSTISPQVTRELAELAGARGVRTLDAPVSGGQPGAVDGTLSIMVGGDEQDFARAKPVFEPLGSAVLVGATGAGQVTKACNQIVVAQNIEAVAEALVLGSRAGVDPAAILTALSSGLAGSKVMDAKRDKFLQHDFEPGFRAELHHKDLGIALATAREHGVSLPVTALLDQMLQALEAKGQGGQDHSALLTLVEDAADHRIGSPASPASA